MTLNAGELGKHRAMLCRFLLFLLRNPQDAEDLAQETFRVAAAKGPEPGEARDYGAWLRATARNLVRNHLRQRQRRPAAVPLDGLELAESRFIETGSERDDVWAARREALAACLAKLPQTERDLLRRRYQVGQRVRDIARDLGIEPNSLSKRLERIRERLRQEVHSARNGESSE